MKSKPPILVGQILYFVVSLRLSSWFTCLTHVVSGFLFIVSSCFGIFVCIFPAHCFSENLYMLLPGTQGHYHPRIAYCSFSSWTFGGHTDSVNLDPNPLE